MRASRRSGSITHTSRVPAESQSAILASDSPGRSPGDRTSTTRSGPSGGKPKGDSSGIRSQLTNAMSAPHSDLAVSKTGRLVYHQDTPHKVCAFGHTRLQQVLRGHERRHVRNVDMLDGHRKETVDAHQLPVNLDTFPPPVPPLPKGEGPGGEDVDLGVVDSTHR